MDPERGDKMFLRRKRALMQHREFHSHKEHICVIPVLDVAFLVVDVFCGCSQCFFGDAFQ
jgi:hypothetical protein